MEYSYSSRRLRLLLTDYDDGDAILPPVSSPPPSPAPFRPGIAVVIGVLTSVFSLTFLLLLYARHCKRTTTSDSAAAAHPYSGGFAFSSSGAGERRNSGVDRAVVESLPVFRFGALRGQKAMEGLECAVCLGRFEPAEALRLLPKCRHAFHVECVDTWLDAHSTCPLCRARVDPEDVLLLPEPPKPSTTSKEMASIPSGRRVSGRHSTGSVQAAARPSHAANRRSADLAGGAAVGCFDLGRVRKDRVLMTEPPGESDREAFERRFSHQIVVGTYGEVWTAAERWSDLRPSDLMFLRSEMLVSESGRLSCSALSSGRGVNSSNGRCLSELAGVSRLGAAAEDERAMMRRWLGFAARRTARWMRAPPPPPPPPLGTNGPST